MFSLGADTLEHNEPCGKIVSGGDSTTTGRNRCKLNTKQRRSGYLDDSVVCTLYSARDRSTESVRWREREGIPRSVPVNVVLGAESGRQLAIRVCVYFTFDNRANKWRERLYFWENPTKRANRGLPVFLPLFNFSLIFAKAVLPLLLLSYVGYRLWYITGSVIKA